MPVLTRRASICLCFSRQCSVSTSARESAGSKSFKPAAIWSVSSARSDDIPLQLFRFLREVQVSHGKCTAAGS